MADTLDFPGYITTPASYGFVPSVITNCMEQWLMWDLPQEVIDRMGPEPSLVEISAIGNDILPYKADGLPTNNWKDPHTTWEDRTGDCEEQALLKMAAINHYRQDRIEVGIMIVEYLGGLNHAYCVTRSEDGRIMILNNAWQAPAFGIEELQKADDIRPIMLVWARVPDKGGQVVIWGRPSPKVQEQSL